MSALAYRERSPSGSSRLLQSLQESTHVFVRVVQPESDHQRSLRVGKVATDGKQHVRSLKRAGSTRRFVETAKFSSSSMSTRLSPSMYLIDTETRWEGSVRGGRYNVLVNAVGEFLKSRS